MKKKQNDRIQALCHSESELINQFSKAQIEFLEFFENNVKTLPNKSKDSMNHWEEIDPILKENLAKDHFGSLVNRLYPRFGQFVERLDLFILEQEAIPSKIVKMIADLSNLLRMKVEEEGGRLEEREGKLLQIEADMDQLWKDLQSFESHFKEIRQEFIRIKGYLQPGIN
jgi:hypothetical protein